MSETKLTIHQVWWGCSNPTLKEHIKQRDWEAIAYHWHTMQIAGHGLPLIKAEWRQTLVDEARKDGVDLLALSEQR